MIEEIGRKIRNLRTAAELTQDELAGRAGLTDGFISQVERGLTSISVDSLKQILDALNVSLAEFFEEEEPVKVVFREKDRVELEEVGTGKLLLLVPGATNREMEPALLRLEPGQSTDIRPPFQGDVFGYVLQGRVQLDYGGDNHKVGAGNCFYFTAEHEHQISNPGGRHAELLWITAPPSF